MPNYILGISAYYHDSAAALLQDGVLIAAAQEERFTRRKHDPAFPAQAIQYALQKAQIKMSDLTAVVFYDKPLLKFERLIETYLSFAPRGYSSFASAMPVWLKEKLFIKSTLKKELKLLRQHDDEGDLPPLLFSEHHRSHAASAFFASPFEQAAVLCLDGVGEWDTTSAWIGKSANLDSLWTLQFPHSLGLLYSAFTYYTGFKVNSGEYKLMGLAPYGKPIYTEKILEHLIDAKEDGTFRLNMDYFDFATGLKMTNEKFNKLFDGPPRKAESPLGQREMDLASSIQKITEEVLLRMAHNLAKETQIKNLCLAGGVALNCVANGRLLREGPFEKIWIQPAAGDAGGAIGAAYVAWHDHFKRPRSSPVASDTMMGGFLGPPIQTLELEKYLDAHSAPFTRLDEKDLTQKTAQLLSEGSVVGWCQGAMEFGPRSLGARSILGDPRNPQMQSIMNLKIKFRESFRPFAPAVLLEDCEEYFDLDRESPYMMLVADVKKSRRIPLTDAQKKLSGMELLNIPRSEIPAVTHVDFSARVQTVEPQTNPLFYSLLRQFKAITGCPVLINTSFNVRGEPIVCTAMDAYRCFMRTEMDYLAVGPLLIKKSNQPPWTESSKKWTEVFLLD